MKSIKVTGKALLVAALVASSAQMFAAEKPSYTREEKSIIAWKQRDRDSLRKGFGGLVDTGQKMAYILGVMAVYTGVYMATKSFILWVKSDSPSAYQGAKELARKGKGVDKALMKELE